MDWLQANEFIAIWLEGIALLAIFIWDRIDSHSQHKQTLAQLRVSQEQVEATQKPFLTFTTDRRNAVEAVLDLGGVVGGMVVKCPGGDAELRNVGSGPAINVHYRATHNIEGTPVPGPGPSGYFVGIIPGETFLMPISRGILQGHEWEIVLTYESLSGLKYRTKSIVNDQVLTDIKFERLTA